jgi:predicted transporter
MKVVGLLLVAGVVAVYFYIQQVDRSDADMEARGRVIIPTLALTVIVLTGYILFTSLSK